MNSDDFRMQVDGLLRRLLRESEEEGARLLAEERQRNSAVADAAAARLHTLLELVERLSDPAIARSEQHRLLDEARQRNADDLSLVEELLRDSGVELTALDVARSLLPHEMIVAFKGGADEDLPRTFGPFVLHKKLGKGGQGRVYLAFQTELHRMVAIKIPKEDEHKSALDQERLKEEARAVAAVRHPGVIQMHEVGEIGGVGYFTMEYLRGGSLADALKAAKRHESPSQKPTVPVCAAPAEPGIEENLDSEAISASPNGTGSEPSWPKTKKNRAQAAVRLLIRVARALEAVHRVVPLRLAVPYRETLPQWLLYLDLKPGNILLDDEGEAVLADFGLARWLTAGGPADFEKRIKGTPAYMAPEQAAGRTDLTPATDVYGVGAVLYELLTGTSPFIKQGEESVSVKEVLKRVIDDPLPPFNPRPDPTLEAIVRKCLEKNPDDRFQTAGALADDLEAWLAGRETVTRPWSTTRRFWRNQVWANRNGIAAFSLIIFSLLSALVAKVMDARAETNAKKVVEKQLALEKQDHERTEELLRLECADRLKTVRNANARGDLQTALTGYDRLIADLPPDHADRFVLRVESLPAWFVYHSRQELTDELNRLEKDDRLAGKERARVLLLHGDLLMGEYGRSAAARALIQQALDSKLLEPDGDAAYAEALLTTSSTKARDKLRKLVENRPSHFRGSVALLGLLFVRGEYPVFRLEAERHRARYPDDVSLPLLEAWADLFEKGDLQSATARIDHLRAPLGAERCRKIVAILTLVHKAMHSSQDSPIPVLLDMVKILRMSGNDREVFSINVPTIAWLFESWSKAGSVASPFLLLQSEKAIETAIETFRALRADHPEALFIMYEALLETVLAARFEKKQQADLSRAHAIRAADLWHESIDATTLVPGSPCQYIAIATSLMLDGNILFMLKNEAEPWREERLTRVMIRAVTDVSVPVAQRRKMLAGVASGIRVLPDKVRELLLFWMLSDADYVVPYRLLAKLELDAQRFNGALEAIEHWSRNPHHAVDKELEGMKKLALEGAKKLPEAPVIKPSS